MNYLAEINLLTVPLTSPIIYLAQKLYDSAPNPRLIFKKIAYTLKS